ncbi:MAG: histidine phosphatase family protein [Pseudobutyrivibrio sp.]|nr:histidine phosphatase family protein [Pseudobutyrivibrio sp.]
MEKTIHLIRHGKTQGNIEKRYIGVTDEGLCQEGIDALKNKKYPEVDIVFCSPMSRCVETARLIYPNIHPIVVAGLKETNFGEFEGKNYEDLENNPKYEEWLESGGMAPFPGGESSIEVKLRTMAAFNKLMYASKDVEYIAMVVHGGTIMTILSELFGGEYYNYHVENGKGYTFELSHNGVCTGLRPRSFDR